MHPLRLYEDYSREEVHDIFAPDAPFTPGAGTWGLLGIVAIPDRPGDYVFFVTYGRQQGEHVFDEGVTEEGVLTWQSQPRQGLDDQQIRQFIAHDETINTIHLFLRTRMDAPYTYLGRLAYLSHDRERENPVYFMWQILPDRIPSKVADRIGLELQPGHVGERAPPAGAGELEQTPPPVRHGARGESTPAFRRRKRADYALRDAENRALGHAGERLVVETEMRSLRLAGRHDLAGRVRHVAEIEGDGAGYDVESYTPDGEVKYIEVKTTQGAGTTAFFLTANELAFADRHSRRYYLYRVYDFDLTSRFGRLYVVKGSPGAYFELRPTEYRVLLPSQVG